MGLLNEEDKKFSLVSLSIIIAIVWGFVLMSIAVWKPNRQYIVAPVSGVIIVALGGTAVKANKGSS